MIKKKKAAIELDQLGVIILAAVLLIIVIVIITVVLGGGLEEQGEKSKDIFRAFN